MVERNSHESGLKCDLLQDYRTIFPLPQGFATVLQYGGGRIGATRLRQTGATAQVESADSHVL